MDTRTRGLAGGESVRVAGTLRAAARASALIVTTIACYLLLIGGRAFARVLRRSPDRWTQRVFRTWARWLLRILGVRVETRGPRPTSPFLLVSNHLSYLDVLVYAAVAEPVFISKHDVADWPFAGHLTKSVGTIFVDRAQKRDLPRVACEIDDRLRRGLGVVLFAEGTSTDGSEILPFKPSLLEPACRAGLSPHYATLVYETPADAPPARLSVCWWGDMSFGPHLWGLLHVLRIDAHVTFGPEPIAAADRRILAEELWQAARRQHRPVSQ